MGDGGVGDGGVGDGGVGDDGGDGDVGGGGDADSSSASSTLLDEPLPQLNFDGDLRSGEAGFGLSSSRITAEKEQRTSCVLRARHSPLECVGIKRQRTMRGSDGGGGEGAGRRR